MTRRTLLGMPALGLVLALAAPPSAEAAHRHSRFCRHGRSYGYGYNYGYGPYWSRPPAYYGYDYGYGWRGPRTYGYSPYYGPYYRPYYRGYGGYSRYGYGYSRFHYHGGRRCSRPHFSIHLDF